MGSNHAQTFGGLGARLASKLTAHTLCRSINRLLGRAEALQIKHLAFPNEHKTLVVIPPAGDSVRSVHALSREKHPLTLT